MSSTNLLFVAVIGYAVAMFMYIAQLAVRKTALRKVATVTVALAFLTQIAGLITRWYEAGLVEVSAAERATGLTLHGLQRFVVFTQHPPWSNLYEIMVYMAFGVVLVFLISEVKLRVRFAGIFALLLALVAFSLASTTENTIKPLVPALQSWWIHIHVISASIGYSAGTIGAIASFLFLLKARDRVSVSAVGAGSLFITLGLFAVLGGFPKNPKLFMTGQYYVKLMTFMQDMWIPAQLRNGESFVTYNVPSPGVGPLMIVTMVLALVGAIMLLMKRTDPPSAAGRAVFGLTFGATTATLALIVIHGVMQKEVTVAAADAARIVTPGPWKISLHSAPWDLALFVIAWVSQLTVFATMLFPEKMRTLLPDAKRLDRTAYYSILISFTLVAVVLVTGALWAHYAWGRYWGWDPKETGALVIWLTYALYLHARVTYGWVGVPSAVIGVIGFFVIIAGFLGVNLGWFADGLHSYGSA